MAPSRGTGSGSARAGPSVTSGRRTSRKPPKSRGAVLDVYQGLLDEAAHEPGNIEPDRPLKRRRVLAPVDVPPHNVSGDGAVASSAASRGSATNTSDARPALQTMEQSSDDESDWAFEDVDLDQPAAVDPDSESASDDDIADVSVAVDQTTASAQRTRSTRRKPATAAERAFRLLVHKTHFLCLLGHCIFANGWCNSEVVQKHIRPVLSEKTVKWFDSKSDSQAARHLTFIEALQKCRDDFGQHFVVTASGMRKAHWANADELPNVQSDVEPVDLAEFISAAKRREGSQDVGNQLFCALLRSIGIEARLVCSLQPLPFAAVSGKGSTAQKGAKTVIYARPPETSHHVNPGRPEDAALRGSKRIGIVPSARRRLGQPSFAAEPAPPPRESKKKFMRQLTYPVWWVEAFDEAYQKWVAVDPIVTKTVNQPSKLEPPFSYHELNQLTYVIAFESDGVAKDVTRRYAKAYNAKTRRCRIESTEHGSQWLKKTMRVFRRRGRLLDREQVEDAELAQKEAKEGLPTNVQDFKDHPYYALCRHIKRHEVLHPRREVGKVNAGTAAKPRMEAVFRRQDVQVCRSAEKWFRLGREVKEGEQPLKHVTSQRRPRAVGHESEDSNADEERAKQTPLYSFLQTAPYIPNPVLRGRVPRNAFGNLDIHVPSMVPAGGTHIRHSLTQQAARLLQIDYADAVTGFTFKARRGTAVIEGAVVPTQFADAVGAVVEGLEWMEVEDGMRRRSAVALRLWGRWLSGLRIRKRVRGGDHEGPTNNAVTGDDVVSAGDAADFDEGALFTAGRYTLAELLSESGAAAKAKKRKVKSDEDSHRMRADAIGNEETSEPDISSDFDATGDGDACDGGGFLRSEAVAGTGCREEGGFAPEDDKADESEGGGFLAPDEEGHWGGGGGYTAKIVEEEEEEESSGGFRPSEDDGDADGDGGLVPPQESPVDDVGGESSLPDAPNLRNGIEIQPTEAANSTAAGSKDAETNLTLSQAAEHRPVLGCSAIPHAQKGTASGKERNDDDDDDDDDDDEDVDSLLSHDPEDEDAEPDWLESD